MKLIAELRRRNVLRMAALYLGAAWLVMQVVDLLIDRGPLPESLGPITLTVLAIGFPIAVILSWFFEVTSAGVTLDDDAQAAATVATGGQRMNYVVIAVLAAAVLMFAFDKWWTAPPPERSVAVLPFVDMTADNEAAYLGAGVADTILNMLVTIPDLHVASRTSSFQPRLEGLGVPEVADLLGVTTVLEGSIQRQGDRLRITAQLIDASNDNHLWSQNFDRDYGDVFAIQDEIAEAVASALQIAVGDDARQRIDREGTDNLAAFEEYSKAIELLRVRTFDSVAAAAEMLQRAVELDPDFARAHASLGFVYIDSRFGAWADMTDEEREARARDAATTALRIAPGLSPALVLLGRLTADDAARVQLYREALANAPNDTTALRAYSRYLAGGFQTDEAMALAEKLIRLDPLDEANHRQLAFLQMVQFQIPEALKTIARGKEKVPGSVELLDLEAFCYFGLGEYSSAIVAKYDSMAEDPKEFINRWSIATLYLLADMPDEAERWFERASETAPERDRSGMQLMHQTMLNVYHQRNDEDVFASFQQWPPFSFGLEQRGVGELFVEYGVRLGKLDEVLELFKEMSPHLFTEPPTDLYKDAYELRWAAMALLRYGDADKAHPLVTAVFDELAARKNAGFFTHPLVADFLLAQGETEAALESFRKYVADNKYYLSGNGAQFLYRHSSLYDPIRNEPEFVALIKEYDRNAAEQQALLKAMDLPVK